MVGHGGMTVSGWRGLIEGEGNVVDIDIIVEAGGGKQVRVVGDGLASLGGRGNGGAGEEEGEAEQ